MALLTMTPPCGERVLRYVGDSVEFELRHPSGAGGDVRFERAFLRTNVGRASRLREETIQTRSGAVAGLGGFWRDVPMIRTEWGWRLRLTLAEVGFFESKAYAVDEVGRQHWPEGANHGIAVHPDALRTGNTIYCAFVRLFGETRAMRTTQDEALAERVQGLDRLGYSVIPRSGTLRDLKGQLPHIFQTLKCRYLHLLPIQPTPTTFARFGRFGSPYACKELTDVDAALAEFDKRTTAIDQFVELADAVHGFGGKLLLDMVINHTGWNSALQERHPEWFVREADGRFASPGAWGTIWEDLVELHPWHHELWDTLADAFLTWCRRGVDGFRCDAGYKVPAPVWQYIVARVREEFADTVFLLEGLGGGWGDTERLLTTGGMQWAYSELFQEYSGTQVAGYLAHSLRQSERVGTLVHYSETHDNLRLAARGREWSLLRNQLSALTSSSGAFGFTCGVEWLAEEKINVHQCGGLSWGAAEHIVDELAQLNLLLAGHPCFFDGAKLTRLSDGVSSIYALMRTSADGQHRALVLVNLDLAHPSSLMLRDADLGESKEEICELVRSGGTWRCDEVEGGRHFHLAGGLALCLRVGGEAVDGDMGERYRADRSRAAFAIQALSTRLEPEHMGSPNWRALSRYVLADVETFLASLAHVEPGEAVNDLMGALDAAVKRTSYRRVIGWGVGDVGKVTLVPPGHWLLIRAETAFRAVIEVGNGARQWHYESIPVASGHVVAVPPDSVKGDARLVVQRYEVEPTRFKATIRFLNAGLSEASPAMRSAGEIVLLTNGIGGMARIPADFGGVRSKYDCLLGANLHPSVPVDRHVFVKRIRLWAMVNGFLTQLDPSNLSEFDRLHGARWVFHPHGGDGLRVGIWVTVEMVPGRNTTVIRLGRVEVETVGGDTAGGLDSGKRIGAWKPTPVSVTARLDIEDRSFHSQTKRNGGAEVHFAHHTSKLEGRVGFSFRPSVDRGLTVYSDIGVYHSGEEWSVGVPHPVEQTRGQEGFGDAYSPGWFELPLRGEEVASIVATAEPDGVGGWGLRRGWHRR